MISLQNHKNIHCIGIGGIGLSAIAEILLSKGYNVSGSDMKDSELLINLREKGATIFIGHDASNVESADLIVYSLAVSDENPEIVKAKENKIPLVSRASILGLLMDEHEQGIAISGTHGKTTTTSMVSLILEAAKLDPTILVGGTLAEFNGNCKIGRSPFFVTEACEYRDSFLELRPNIEVILNIDSDHLDYFKDIDHIVRSFDSFADNLKPGGKIIAYDANPFIAKVIQNYGGAITYGYNPLSKYHVSDITFSQEGMPSFNINFMDKVCRVELHVPGEHNILNATASFACAYELGVDPTVIASTLSKYTGTKRRFDVLGRSERGCMIIDDYAHHPTEIKATLSASKHIPHSRIWCIFQPHTYTRTLALFDDFVDSFTDADILILTDIYAAREHNIYNVNSESLASKISNKYPDKEVRYVSSMENIVDMVRSEAMDGDIVITMGAGDVYKVGHMIIGDKKVDK